MDLCLSLRGGIRLIVTKETKPKPKLILIEQELANLDKDLDKLEREIKERWAQGYAGYG